MNASHSAFFDRPEGKLFKDILAREDFIPQFELLSKIEIPAVQAAVFELDPLIEQLDEGVRPYAIQSSGALIGDILSKRGFRIARDPKGEKRRGRVRQSRFVKTGTIFEKLSGRPSDDERVRDIVEDLMVRYKKTLEALAR